MKSFKLKNRALAAFLCLALVGGLVGNVFIKGSSEAEASGSLPGITELRNSNVEYNILEIVPDVSQAAFSWYIGDSEPVNEKKITTAYGAEASTLREKYEDARGTLLSQNYLISTEVGGDASSSILKNLGEVKVDGNNISVSGGFENNEWFQRFVLDWNEGETQGQIKMTVLSPQNVTAAHIQLADMVIVSGGYYYPNTSVDPMVYSADVTMTAEVADAIISNAKQGLPVILDRRAYQGAGLESDRVFKDILGADPTTVMSGVYGSVFYFSSVKSGGETSNNIPLSDGGILGISGNTAQGYLVTPQFNTAFDSSVSGANGPFADVLASIQKENVTRLAYQQTLLSEEITMARVVQYLISGSDLSAGSTMKETVRVLSIQPGDASGIAAYNSSIHDNFNLAPPSVTAKVGLPTDSTKEAELDQVSWEDLESWTGVSRAKITVVEMTMGEFIRQSDVVASTYDLVYIGNDISENVYGVYEENAQFNTNGFTLAANGNETYFAALGDTMEKPGYSYNTLTNDISIAKYNELMDYVMAGRPVVVAPYLSAGLNFNTSSAKPAVMTVDPDSNLYKLMSIIADQSSVIRQDMLLSGPDGVEGNGDDNTMVENLVSSVHIPTPTVEFATLSASMPDVYSESTVLSFSGETQSTLDYIFKITNTSSESGLFKVAVTLDLDGDGIYEVICNNFNSFKVTGLVTDTDGTLLLDSGMNPQIETQVEYNSLTVDKFYQVSFDLPDSVTGIVPWKLDVTSLDNSAITSSTTSLTYSANEAPREISVLQIFADSSMDMKDSAQMMRLMGLDGDNYSDINSMVDFTLHTLTLDNFNAVAAETEEGTAIKLNDYAQEVANFVPSAVESSQTGQLAMAVAMNAYDVVVLSSFTENGELSKEALEILTVHMNSEANLLYTHEKMPTTENTDAYFWNTDTFKNYPYELDMDDYYVYSFDTTYYTNADVIGGENDCRILVNTINLMVPFSEPEFEQEEEEDDAPNQVDLFVYFYDEAENGDRLVAPTLKLAEKDSGGVHETEAEIYFQISTISTENCYFNAEVVDVDSSITGFSSNDGMTAYKFGSEVKLSDRYLLEIPEELWGKNCEIIISAYDLNTENKIAQGSFKLEAVEFVEPEIDLFYYAPENENDDEFGFVNLIPMG